MSSIVATGSTLSPKTREDLRFSVLLRSSKKLGCVVPLGEDGRIGPPCMEGGESGGDSLIVLLQRRDAGCCNFFRELLPQAGWGCGLTTAIFGDTPFGSPGRGGGGGRSDSSGGGGKNSFSGGGGDGKSAVDWRF